MVALPPPKPRRVKQKVEVVADEGSPDRNLNGDISHNMGDQAVNNYTNAGAPAEKRLGTNASSNTF